MNLLAPDLVERLSNEYLDGKPLEVPAERRADVIVLIERLMLDPDALLLHERVTLHGCDLAIEDVPLPAEQESAILKREWDAVPNTALAQLFINPCLIERLGDRVAMELPPGWESVFAHVGRLITDRCELENSIRDDVLAIALEGMPATTLTRHSVDAPRVLAASTGGPSLITGKDGVRFRLEDRPTGETIVDAIGFTPPGQGVAKLFVVRFAGEQELVLTQRFDEAGTARVRTEDIAEVKSGVAQLALRIVTD